MITSPDNPKLKAVRRMQRRRDPQRFVAEGEDLVEAAAAHGWEAEAVLVAADSGLEGEEVEPSLLAGASGLGSGTRALAILERRLADAPAGPRCLCLWGVKDPGNVGSAVRSAHALGASSVALGPETADPFGPKAVRASMGALFALPLARVDDVAQLPGETVALVARAGEPLRGGPADGTVVVGAEREGLPEDVVAACDRTAHVALAPGADSLNAAMAATVALYEWGRA